VGISRVSCEIFNDSNETPLISRWAAYCVVKSLLWHNQHHQSCHMSSIRDQTRCHIIVGRGLSAILIPLRISRDVGGNKQLGDVGINETLLPLRLQSYWLPDIT
jgi:hypothetical protein